MSLHGLLSPHSSLVPQSLLVSDVVLLEPSPMSLHSASSLGYCLGGDATPGMTLTQASGPDGSWVGDHMSMWLRMVKP